MKGQISAEMLILLVVVLAIVALAAMTMMGSAKKASEGVQGKTEEIVSGVDEVAKGDSGAACVKDANCRSNSCYNNICQ
ncbi:MAG: class III signal peptide-containing protein [Candidatus Bilamarchaeaceae archaeon]